MIRLELWAANSKILCFYAPRRKADWPPRRNEDGHAKETEGTRQRGDGKPTGGESQRIRHSDLACGPRSVLQGPAGRREDVRGAGRGRREGPGADQDRRRRASGRSEGQGERNLGQARAGVRGPGCAGAEQPERAEPEGHRRPVAAGRRADGDRQEAVGRRGAARAGASEGRKPSKLAAIRSEDTSGAAGSRGVLQ